MAIDFSKLLSPKTRARLDATHEIITRLYYLPDRWLAEELLRLARRMRHDHPDRLGNPAVYVYDAGFVWHVVPEIAKRLGAIRLHPNEATRGDIVTLQGQDFRECVGCFLANISQNWPRPIDAEGTPTAADILTHEIANGQPAAFALDRPRLNAPPPPPGHDRNDYVARHVREISRNRSHGETPYWSPDLQLPARPSRLVPRLPPRRPAEA